MKKILVSLVLLAISILLFAQTNFRYQAIKQIEVEPQNVNIRIGIIQGNINNEPVYVETHTTASDHYGFVNLNIGAGTTISGNYNAINWNQPCFTKVEIDPSGGTNYQHMETKEWLAVPKALVAESANHINFCSIGGKCVKDYGAVGDDTTDDTHAFQLAIEAAFPTGSQVIVPAGNYRITSTLVVPSGIVLVGEGAGATALGTPFNGSAIRYEGSGAAVLFIGDFSGMKNMLVYDKNQGSTSADGIYIKADGTAVESFHFSNVLIHYFTGGTALRLDAINGGGMAYGNFNNIRIRNAKTGIHIHEDENSFNNSHMWQHGVISGGGFDYCLRVTGGNNNQFYGTVFEPYQSTAGHIVVEKGEISCKEIRIEAQTQPDDIPVVNFFPGTRNSYMNGLFAHGSIMNKGNNDIAFHSQKATFHTDAQSNLFENPNFYGWDGSALPFWDISGNGVTIEVLEPVLHPEHKVIKLTVPAGVTANLEQAARYIQQLGNLPAFEQLHFGMYVKADVAGMVYLRSNAPAGVISSATHPGDGDWQFIGMTAIVDTTATLDAKLEINNTSGAAVTVSLSCPTMNFGKTRPALTARPLTSAGGIMTGTLTNGMSGFSLTENFITLPREGNIFELSGTTDIHRINHVSNNVFPRGTIIVLLFNQAGVGVLNSPYIQLLGAYNSVANSSLTLVSKGDGTWRELSRNL